MKPKKITSIQFSGQTFFAILSCIIFAFFLSACGGGGSSGSYTSDTGAIAFNIEWADQSQDNSSARAMDYEAFGAIKPAALDCGSSGVVDITAELYEASGEHIVEAGPWACSAHSGVMENIPVGTNRTLHVYGKDGGGNVLYMGVTTGIDVVAGQTADAGTVVLDTATYMSIDYAYLQYRVFWDGVNDAYRGWLTLSKFGEPAGMSDVLTDSEMVSITKFEASSTDLLKNKIKLKNSSGTVIPIASIGRSAAPYFIGRWNSSTSSVDFEGPYKEFGFYMRFDVASVPAGDYTYEVTTDKGDVITRTVYFPGETTLPTVQVMAVPVWQEDDSLHLSWNHPGGSFDQFRVSMSDQNYNDLLYVKLPSDMTEVTIPASVVQNMTDTLSPFVARWRMQTRNYGSDNNNYARGISDRIDFAWLEQPTPPAGKYDLLQYVSFSAGSWWSYWEYDGENPDGWQADDEFVEYAGNFKGLANIRRYTSYLEFVDYAGYFNFDGQYIYYHGESEYDENDPGYGSSYFSPSIEIKRFLGVAVGDNTSTSSATYIDPDGNETAVTFTIELLEHLDECTAWIGEIPYVYSDCLRIKQTWVVAGSETEITEIWWAYGVGEVMSVEIQDPGDDFPDTKVLTDHYFAPYFVEPG